MHSEKSAIRSRGWVCAFQPGLASNRLGSGTQSDPTLSRGSGVPNHYVGDLLLTIAISGLSPVRTELMQLAVVATLPSHPVQMHCQLASHRHLGDLPSTPQGKTPVVLTSVRLATGTRQGHDGWQDG